MKLFATVYVKNKAVVVESEDINLRREITQLIENAVKENRIVKRVVKKPGLVRWFGRTSGSLEQLAKDLHIKVEEIYEEFPLRPGDPEFLEWLLPNPILDPIWLLERADGYRLTPDPDLM